MKRRVMLGVIADDFTGAGDAASFLVKGGRRTALVTALDENVISCDCLVAACKVRSVPVPDALNQVARACDYLDAQGAERIYFKFCSTFDSTPQGNIGPIMDYLMKRYDQQWAALCPSLPVNGRTVCAGNLYVNGELLAESPMRNHPLNPMWESYIPTLMQPQSAFPCKVVSRDQMAQGGYLQALISETADRFYIVPDYETDDDARAIARAIQDSKVVGGGSGLLEYLLGPVENMGSATKVEGFDGDRGPCIMVCGSCSAMTRKQIEAYVASGGLASPIDSKMLLDGKLTAEQAFSDVLAALPRTTLLYSDAVDKNVSELTKSSTFERESKLLEDFFAQLCVLARNHGFSRIIAAGGETSGAVGLALGYTAYVLKDVVAPGVPELEPVGDHGRTVILKSGNFGGEDFFFRAEGRAS